MTSERANPGIPRPVNASGADNAVRAAQACDAMRGKETVVLDLRSVTPLFDFFVISTGSNTRQTRAMAEEVNRVLKGQGSPRQAVEGLEPGSWIVQDYGDIVLHVFTPEDRERYDLEHLWGDAPKVEWSKLILDEAVSA